MKKGLGQILAALAKVLCAWVAMINFNWVWDNRNYTTGFG